MHAVSDVHWCAASTAVPIGSLLMGRRDDDSVAGAVRHTTAVLIGVHGWFGNAMHVHLFSDAIGVASSRVVCTVSQKWSMVAKCHTQLSA